MAATNAGSTVVTSQTVAAGSSQDAVASSDIDLTAAYEATIAAVVTNGATGPTAGCIVNVYTSPDGTNWVLLQSITAKTANSGVTQLHFELPAGTPHAKIGFGGNTGQNVTAVAYLYKKTAI